MDTLEAKTTPAVIDTNFEALKQQLATELEKYDVVVTEDTVKEAKDLSAQLNKLKSEIATRRKEVVAAVSGPVKVFEEQVKGLEKMCADGREKLKSQIGAFEEVKLNNIKSALICARDELYEANGIREEYRTVQVDSLVKLGSFTAGGKLTKAAKDGVAGLVAQVQLHQQRTDMRLSQLEAESYKAGLHSPLSKEHVAGIINGSDREYEDGLKAMLDKEAERQRAIIAAAKPEIEDVPPAQEESSTQIEVPSQTAQAPEPAAEPAPIQQMNQPAQSAPAQREVPTRPVEITVSLMVDAPVNAPLAAVESALKKKLVSAGVEKSIRSIFATEVTQGVA